MKILKFNSFLETMQSAAKEKEEKEADKGEEKFVFDPHDVLGPEDTIDGSDPEDEYRDEEYYDDEESQDEEDTENP